tara:strand:+ start:191 stop:535 length:345 start_codon:yes stop_codon:yes gene_type:complete
MNKYDSKAIDCAYRALAETTSRNIVILTHPEDSSSVGKGVAGALPPGSVCTGSVWKTPDGRTIAIKRYTDPVPTYKDSYKLMVCNGGRHMTQEDGQNLDRWRAGGPSPVPFVAP